MFSTLIGPYFFPFKNNIYNKLWLNYKKTLFPSYFLVLFYKYSANYFRPPWFYELKLFMNNISFFLAFDLDRYY